MNSERIRELGNRRAAARAGYQAAHAKLLEALVEELGQDAERGDIAQAIKDAGVARGTVYKALAGGR